MSNKIVFCFDCVSPWSYIAFHVLKRYRSKWDLGIEWMPCSLAFVMKYSANKPPVAVPNKGAHLVTQLSRAAKMYDGM